MARASGSERHLLLIYTGGTLGMQSKGGGESEELRPLAALRIPQVLEPGSP